MDEQTLGSYHRNPNRQRRRDSDARGFRLEARLPGGYTVSFNPSPMACALRILLFAALLAGLPQAVADPYEHLDPSTRALLKQLDQKYRSGMRYLPGYELSQTQADPGLPRVFAPTRPRETYTKYPWKENIVTTVFWIGEAANAEKNSPANIASSWDTKWMENYGGYDDPDPSKRAWDFRPASFIPGQNPFYCALPFNDLAGWKRTKPTAQKVVPWFKERYTEFGETVLRGQWLAIRCGTQLCFAQWEDVGPFETDDWPYVFGTERPRTTKNNTAGLDVSPAVRDFLKLRSGQACDWRFVELEEVPPGPWRKFGDNNHFVQMRLQQSQQDLEAKQAEMVRLREARDNFVRSRSAR